jgi:hypothetical protein
MRWHARALLPVALTLAAVACSSNSSSARGDGGSDGAGGAEGGTEVGGNCGLAPSGSFTFHVHNAGATTLILDLGCGATSPLTLATPNGALPGGPGNVDVCEFSCDQIYTTFATPGGCTDCGAGMQRTVAAGATADIAWNRNVYVERAVDPACTPKQGMCASAIPVAPVTSQQGTLTSCPIDQHPTGSCLSATTTSFNVDTTGSEATIDVGP